MLVFYNGGCNEAGIFAYDIKDGSQEERDYVYTEIEKRVKVFDGVAIPCGKEDDTVILHANQPMLLNRNTSKCEVPIYQNPEWQANVGAGALLMPSARVYRDMGQIPEEQLVDELSRKYQVSCQAAQIRIAHVKKIAE